jgi:hypothetical protein
MNRLLFLYLTLATPLVCAGEGWSAALREWTREIEAAGGQVIPVRVVTDPNGGAMRFEGEVAHRGVVARYMADDNFRAQLVAAHALTLNYRGPEGRLHFIIMNIARAPEWSDHAEGMLAHEVGHAWLDAMGYAGVTYESGSQACLSTHITDVVQHVMIRSEMRRRRIDSTGYWLSKLTPLIADLESGNPPKVAGPCGQALLLSQWLDARLGTSPEAWEKLRPIELAFAEAYPEVGRCAADIESLLRVADLMDPVAYRTVLEAVRARIHRLAADSTGF